MRIRAGNTAIMALREGRLPARKARATSTEKLNEFKAFVICSCAKLDQCHPFRLFHNTLHLKWVRLFSNAYFRCGTIRAIEVPYEDATLDASIALPRRVAPASFPSFARLRRWGFQRAGHRR